MSFICLCKLRIISKTRVNYKTANMVKINSVIGLLFLLGSSGVRGASTIAQGVEFVQKYVNSAKTFAIQASGKVISGCNGSSDCYTLSLGSSGDSFAANSGSVDMSDRQRIEFLTDYNSENNGQSWEYSWTSSVSKDTGLESSQWMHMWQLFTDAGAFVQLTAMNNKVSVRVKVAGARKRGKCSTTIPYDDFKGNTYNHSMKVTYGPDGSMTYTMTDASTKKQTLSCSYSGQVMQTFHTVLNKYCLVLIIFVSGWKRKVVPQSRYLPLISVWHDQRIRSHI